MTNQDAIAKLLKALTNLNNEKNEAAKILTDDPNNLMGILLYLFEYLYPLIPSIQNQFHELRNLLNDRLQTPQDN